MLSIGTCCRFAEAAAWAAARWADTYLLPEPPTEPSTPAMAQAFSLPSPTASQTLATLVRVVTSSLTQPAWAGEVDLHRVAVVKLLFVLVRKAGAAALLVALPEWQQLAGACRRPPCMLHAADHGDEPGCACGGDRGDAPDSVKNIARLLDS